jgi:hypothetical protein
VVVVVPLFVNRWVVQAIVGAEVDDSSSGGKEVLDYLGAGGVWEAAEDAVGSLGDFSGAQVFESQVEAASEKRVDVADVRLVVLPGGKRRDLGLRVREQEANQLFG